MGRYTLPKSERILKSSEYDKIRKAGKRMHTRHFIINYLAADTGRLRLGMAVSKKVGKAVKRNRVKRQIREFFRLNKHELGERLQVDTKGMDLVFVAKSGSEKLGWHEINMELTNGFKRLADEHMRIKSS